MSALVLIRSIPITVNKLVHMSKEVEIEFENPICVLFLYLLNLGTAGGCSGWHQGANKFSHGGSYCRHSWVLVLIST